MTSYFQSIKDIKTRGYYILNFRPTKYEKSLIKDVAKLQPMVKEAQVSLRGWSFPVVPPFTREWADIYVAQNKLEAWCTTDHNLETWRYYQSGQFIDIKGIEEDWFQESSFLAGSPLSKVEPLKFIDAIGLIYEVTEYFIFFANLSRNEELNEVQSFEIGITIQGIKNRKLTVFSNNRAPLSAEYFSRTESIKKEITVNKEELQTNCIEIARDFIMYIYTQFNWLYASIKLVEDEQKKLIERRI